MILSRLRLFTVSFLFEFVISILPWLEVPGVNCDFSSKRIFKLESETFLIWISKLVF